MLSFWFSPEFWGKGFTVNIFTIYITYLSNTKKTKVNHIFNTLCILTYECLWMDRCQLFRKLTWNVNHHELFVLVSTHVNEVWRHIVFIRDNIIILFNLWFYNILCEMLSLFLSHLQSINNSLSCSFLILKWFQYLIHGLIPGLHHTTLFYFLLNPQYISLNIVYREILTRKKIYQV